jgi:hypothetical protein
VVEAIQAIIKLRPPPKMLAAVQKLINCCPAAAEALEQASIRSDHSGVCDFMLLTQQCFLVTQLCMQRRLIAHILTFQA